MRQAIGTQVRALTAALLLGTMILGFSPGHTAHAARAIPTEMPEAGGNVDIPEDSGGGYTARRKPDLVSNGYTCVKIATGFTECTKPGSPTYWCDASGACETKPFRNRPDVEVAPRGGKATTP